MLLSGDCPSHLHESAELDAGRDVAYHMANVVLSARYGVKADFVQGCRTVWCKVIGYAFEGVQRLSARPHFAARKPS